ncbi:MAG TPA: hypothetical protein VLS27_14545, partial [Gammaproteobacteria bacterium]|nr:hypothetical protein [Gammaproteobacteria bacterium]
PVATTSTSEQIKKCEFPRRMHKVSRLFLDAYVGDNLSLSEFRRRFSLPNSDYVALASCITRQE